MLDTEVRVGVGATTAMDGLSEGNRHLLLEALSPFRGLHPKDWPTDRKVDVPGSGPAYYLRFASGMQAILFWSEEAGDVEIGYIVRDEFLKLLHANGRHEGPTR